MVTGEQVKNAAIAAGLTFIPHHNCGCCGYTVGYMIDGDNLYFAPGCDCHWGQVEPRSWDSAAEWINMQDKQWQEKIAARFGMTLHTVSNVREFLAIVAKQPLPYA